jgi:hypothetical protein
MSLHVVRIELYGSPSGTDYEALHGAMSEQGFYRTGAIDGVQYHLPHAEYARNSNEALAATLTRAQQAASSVPYHAGILAMDVSVWTQSGLRAVKPR